MHHRSSSSRVTLVAAVVAGVGQMTFTDKGHARDCGRLGFEGAMYVLHSATVEWYMQPFSKYATLPAFYKAKQQDL